MYILKQYKTFSFLKIYAYVQIYSLHIQIYRIWTLSIQDTPTK